MPKIFSSSIAVLLTFVTVMATPVFAAGSSDGSSGSSSGGTASAPAKSAYDQAKAVVDAGKYKDAVPMLVALTTDNPKNADAWNLLGFSYRNLGQLADSNAAYLKVLTINPNHLGALEYQGELFITTHNITAAKANLDKLQKLCGSCEQAEDLEKALNAAGA